MSFIPVQNAKSLKKRKIVNFLGINRGENVTPGEFFEMKNISPDEYPFLSPSKKEDEEETLGRIRVVVDDVVTYEKAQDIRATISPREKFTPSGFTGVIGTTFYYNGRAKNMRRSAVYSDDGEYLYGMDIAADGDIKLLWSNRTILILGSNSSTRNPYLYYYDTTANVGGTEDFVKCYEYDGNGELEEKSFVINNEGIARVIFTYTTNKNYKGGFYNIAVGDSVFLEGFMTYKDSRWKKCSTNEITSAIVRSYTEVMTTQSGSNYTWSIDISLDLYNDKGKNPLTKGASYKFYNICKKIPYMNDITLHKGRLWGINPNGEYVYASTLGNIFDFDKYENISSDSVFLESSTQGGYEAIASFGDTLVTFKQNELEVIYGELPNEFAVGKSFKDIGCDDKKSVCEVRGVLYFLSDGKFYGFDGINYKDISEKLRKKYESAFSYRDGKFLKVSAISDQDCENLTYDTEKNLWYKGDDIQVLGHFKYKLNEYILKNNILLKVSKDEKNDSWECESTKIFSDDFSLERVAEMWLFVKASANSSIKISTSYDSGEWKEEYFKTFDKDTYKTIRVPIRLFEGEYFKYKIKGTGEMLIKYAEFIYDDGGRVYSNERSKDI